MSEDAAIGRARLGWVCDGCGKHITGSIPVDQCVDCGGQWTEATPERLACDRCGAEDASSVFGSEHNRLCEDCIRRENNGGVCPACGLESDVMGILDNGDLIYLHEASHCLVDHDDPHGVLEPAVDQLEAHKEAGS
jgi:predicted amidophosphoribosyltransferase